MNKTIGELFNDERTKKLTINYKNKVLIDFTRQLIETNEFVELIKKTYKKIKLKIEKMFNGDKVNFTENREVNHFILRANENDNYNEYYKVKSVLNEIKEFTNNIHNNKLLSYNNKKFKNIISIGIGGSYLSIEYVYNAIQEDKKMNLKLLSNIDPVDFYNCIKDINADETIVIIISKTFKTQETMINAEVVRNWLLENIEGNKDEIISKHMVAVSTNTNEIKNFGITKSFEFWDWVGGRFSVWSAVGMLPLSLVYGFNNMEKFLEGGRDADIHFKNELPENNIPIILGAISILNTELGHNVRAILPYSQSLNRFPAHIQQLEMESNGKCVDGNGNKIKVSGEVIFGEPGTNGQHSFYQLLHQGTTIIPCEFIGFCKQKYNYKLKNNVITNHDELMCNIFAQADALAFGKSKNELIKEGCCKDLLPYKVFEGNRPSTILLFKELNIWALGFLTAIYEHRVAVHGFYLNINSFDQWGVELGKILAKKIKKKLEGDNIKLNSSTENLIKFYKS